MSANDEIRRLAEAVAILGVGLAEFRGEQRRQAVRLETQYNEIRARVEQLAYQLGVPLPLRDARARDDEAGVFVRRGRVTVAGIPLAAFRWLIPSTVALGAASHFLAGWLHRLAGQ